LDKYIEDKNEKKYKKLKDSILKKNYLSGVSKNTKSY